GLLADVDEAARSVEVLDQQDDAGDKHAGDISRQAPAPPVDCACETGEPKRGDCNRVERDKDDTRHAVAYDGQAFLLIVEGLVQRLDIKPSRNHGVVLLRRALRLSPKRLLDFLRTAQSLDALLRRLLELGETDANSRVVLEQLQALLAVRGRQKPRAQRRGSDGVGFAHQRVAARFKAIERHREGETDHQGEQAEHGGFEGRDVRPFFNVRADVMSQFDRKKKCDETFSEDDGQRVRAQISHLLNEILGLMPAADSSLMAKEDADPWDGGAPRRKAAAAVDAALPQDRGKRAAP